MSVPDSSMNLVTSFPFSSHFNVTLWQIPRIILTHPSTSDEEVEPLTQGPDDEDLDSDFSDLDSHVYSDVHSSFYTLWKIEKHTGSRYFISFNALGWIPFLCLPPSPSPFPLVLRVHVRVRANSSFDWGVGLRGSARYQDFLRAYLKPRGTQNTLRPDHPESIFGLNNSFKITTSLKLTQSTYTHLQTASLWSTLVASGDVAAS